MAAEPGNAPLIFEMDQLLLRGATATPADLSSTDNGKGVDLVSNAMKAFKPTDYLAAGNGTTDDTAPLNACIAAAANAGPHALVQLDGVFLTTGLVNPHGVRMVGPGRVVKTVAGGHQQLNSYADAPGRHLYGKEYLSRIHGKAAQGQSGTVGRLRIGVDGDSTSADPGYTTRSTSQIIVDLLAVRGVGNLTITNSSDGGNKLADLDLVTLIDGGIDVLFIHCGVNNGSNPSGTRLATYLTDLDAALAAARAHADGGLDDLAIIFVGPNTASDSGTGRDEIWLEQLFGPTLAACRKHKVAFFDTYAFMRDARGAAGIYMDDVGAGASIHPGNAMAHGIWAGVLDAVMPWSEASLFGSSNILNRTSFVYAPLASAQPSAFWDGVDFFRATTGNGWPLDGFCISARNVDGGTLQMLFPYSPNNSRVLTRTANVGSDAFNPWTGVPENVTLDAPGGWISYGGSFPPLRVVRAADGLPVIIGSIKGGTTAINTKIGTMPQGTAPPLAQIVIAAGDAGGFHQVKIEADGDILLQTAGDTLGMHFSGQAIYAA
jgi:hypothetical protein